MSKVVKIILVIVALIIILIGVTIGGCFIIGQNLKSQFKNQTPQSREEISQEIVEHKTPPNYKLQEAMNLFNLIKFASYNYLPDGQKVIIAEPPAMMVDLNENNFKQELTPENINRQLSTQFSSKNVTIEDFKILGEGKLNTQTREIPYIKAEITVMNNRTGVRSTIEGICAVGSYTSKKKNIVILSGNKPGQFNELAIKDFVKNIKLD